MGGERSTRANGFYCTGTTTKACSEAVVVRVDTVCREMDAKASSITTTRSEPRIIVSHHGAVGLSDRMAGEQGYLRSVA